MISTLGQSLILGALITTGAGSILAFVAGAKRSVEGVAWARRAAQLFAILLILANVLMVYALLVPDFSVGYVAKVGSTKVPTWVAVVSLWSSLEGSILFWGAMLGVFVLISVRDMGDHHPEHLPYFLGVLLACGVFFTFLLAGPANPLWARPQSADGGTWTEPVASEPCPDDHPPADVVRRLRRDDRALCAGDGCAAGRQSRRRLRAPAAALAHDPVDFPDRRDRLGRLVGV